MIDRKWNREFGERVIRIGGDEQAMDYFTVGRRSMVG